MDQVFSVFVLTCARPGRANEPWSEALRGRKLRPRRPTPGSELVFARGRSAVDFA